MYLTVPIYVAYKHKVPNKGVCNGYFKIK
jgi:hypothetical protein